MTKWERNKKKLIQIYNKAAQEMQSAFKEGYTRSSYLKRMTLEAEAKINDGKRVTEKELRKFQKAFNINAVRSNLVKKYGPTNVRGQAATIQAKTPIFGVMRTKAQAVAAKEDERKKAAYELVKKMAESIDKKADINRGGEFLTNEYVMFLMDMERYGYSLTHDDIKSNLTPDGIKQFLINVKIDPELVKNIPAYKFDEQDQIWSAIITMAESASISDETMNYYLNQITATKGYQGFLSTVGVGNTLDTAEAWEELQSILSSPEIGRLWKDVKAGIIGSEEARDIIDDVEDEVLKHLTDVRIQTALNELRKILITFKEGDSGKLRDWVLNVQSGVYK